MKTFHMVSALAFAACLSTAVIAAGCDNSSSDTPHDPAKDSGPADTSTTGDSGMGDGGVIGDGGTADSGPPSCYTNPQNHFEIINACTDAQAFDKKPSLPLLLPDGALPPLP